MCHGGWLQQVKCLNYCRRDQPYAIPPQSGGFSQVGRGSIATVITPPHLQPEGLWYLDRP